MVNLGSVVSPGRMGAAGRGEGACAAAGKVLHLDQGVGGTLVITALHLICAQHSVRLYFNF